MSELQIGLLALGALAVLGVLIFNKVQEIRARRDGARHFGSSHDDVLLGSAEMARSDGGPAVHAADDGAGVTERHSALHEPGVGRIEPIWDDDTSELEHAAAAAALRAGVAAPILDARIDFIAELLIDEPLPGSHVMLEVEKFPRGRNVDADGYNESARAWEALDRNAVYEKVRVGIQISDRNGPLRADELDAFQNGVAAMASTLVAQVEWPAEQSPLTRAAELDARPCSSLRFEWRCAAALLSGRSTGLRILAFELSWPSALLPAHPDWRWRTAPGNSARSSRRAPAEPNRIGKAPFASAISFS